MVELFTVSQALILDHHSSNFAFDPSYSPGSTNTSTFLEVPPATAMGGAVRSVFTLAERACTWFVSVYISWSLSLNSPSIATIFALYGIELLERMQLISADIMGYSTWYSRVLVCVEFLWDIIECE